MKCSLFIICLTPLFLAGCGTSGVTVESQTKGGVELPNGRARKIVKEVAPEYPAYLRQKRIAGAVVVRLWVKPDGAVARTEARYAAHPELIPFATAAVDKWVFEPALEGDKRVLVLELPVTFSLSDPSPKK